MRGLACCLLALGAAAAARAEPYIALQNGLSCGGCHVNVTGGGARNTFGSGVGRQALPWFRPEDPHKELWDGAIGERLRIGADLRASYLGHLRADDPYLGEYTLSTGTLYVTAELLPERLVLYADEQLAGGAASRELFALYRTHAAGLYAKAGKFFLPYGLRLQDDEAFTRRVTDFNFDESDVGFEVGAEPGSFSLQAAVTNGSAGGSERDNGKMVSASAGYVRPAWRVGLSAANNDLPGSVKRSLAGLFGGFRAGPIVGLYEVDVIREYSLDAPRSTDAVSHAEIDATLRRGLDLRFWAGKARPDRQLGVGADWTALPGVQLRGWYRRRDGPRGVGGRRDDEAAIEVHVYF